MCMFFDLGASCRQLNERAGSSDKQMFLIEQIITIGSDEYKLNTGLYFPSIKQEFYREIIILAFKACILLK